MNESSIFHEVNKLREMNQNLVFMLGVSASLIMDAHPYLPAEKEKMYEWLMKSVDNFVYKKESIPPFTEK